MAKSIDLLIHEYRESLIQNASASGLPLSVLVLIHQDTTNNINSQLTHGINSEKERLQSQESDNISEGTMGG